MHSDTEHQPAAQTRSSELLTWLRGLGLQLLRGEHTLPELSGSPSQITLNVSALICEQPPSQRQELRRALAQRCNAWRAAHPQADPDAAESRLISGLIAGAALRHPDESEPGPLDIRPQDQHVSGLMQAFTASGDRRHAPEIRALLPSHAGSPEAACAVDEGLIHGLTLTDPETAGRFWKFRNQLKIANTEHGDWKRLRAAEMAGWPARWPVTPLLSPGHTQPEVWESLLRSGPLALGLVREQWNAPTDQLRATARPAPTFRAKPWGGFQPETTLHAAEEDEALDHDFRLIVHWLLGLQPDQRREALNDLTLALVHGRHPLRQLNNALSDFPYFSAGVATELGLWLIRAALKLKHLPADTVGSPLPKDHPLEHLPAEHAPEWLITQLLGRVQAQNAPDPLPDGQTAGQLAACLWLREQSERQYATISQHFGVEVPAERPDEETRRTDELARVFWMGAALQQT